MFSCLQFAICIGQFAICNLLWELCHVATCCTSSSPRYDDSQPSRSSPRPRPRGEPPPAGVDLVLIAGYMVAEVVGGLLTGSLALLADAGHMLSDAAALGLSLFAAWLAERPPTARRTYGYYRTEILAALANGATLVAISVYIVVEAIRRMHEPPDVLGGPMLGVACGGLLVNIAAPDDPAPRPRRESQYPRRVAARIDRRAGQRGRHGRRRADLGLRLELDRRGGLGADRAVGRLLGLAAVGRVGGRADGIGPARRGRRRDPRGPAGHARRGRRPRLARLDDHHRARFALGPHRRGQRRPGDRTADLPAAHAARPLRHRARHAADRTGRF